MYGTITMRVPMAPSETKLISFCSTTEISQWELDVNFDTCAAVCRTLCGHMCELPGLAALWCQDNPKRYCSAFYEYAQGAYPRAEHNIT